ncbi:hypothetical protein D9M73_259840 [compost metagenome]
MSYEGHAVQQVDPEQTGHCDAKILLEKCQHGLVIIVTLGQLHPLLQQRALQVVQDKQAANGHSHFPGLQQIQRVVTVQNAKVPRTLVVGRLRCVVHADALGYNVQQGLD